MGGRRLLALALLAGCAAGKFHDEMQVNGARLREGMAAKDLVGQMGPPGFVSKAEHRFAWEFRDTGRAIEPGWEEWVWFDENEYDTYVPYVYVAYVSGEVVERVGVIKNSPPPTTGTGDACR